jgi:hypothetical protein
MKAREILKDLEAKFEGIIIPFPLAKLCCEQTCNMIFVGDKCPRCNSSQSLILSKIIN